MSTVAVTEFIDASTADVWRLLTDLAARPGWLSTADQVEALTPGPFGPGTSWRECRERPDGELLVEEFLVVEAVPPHRLVLSSAGVGVNYRITWTLRTVERRRQARTAVTVEQEAEVTAAYVRWVTFLLGGLAARAVESALRRDLADLARALPSTGAPAAA
ncbi:SRPBCC family protein [Micromonospora mirobrigensis]|uniref:Polyketide cyclase / dehydrase and lipid transport n=1 Tax=Micromonospora mirobrigensis TaxID=262898 RepID=A0A1C4ZQS7_9ACTN|nr:SRPBCC family protein [Micromonospora mirobrigensis]SCF35363.1 Polyketide cyclase / dehydrase and lipid transport [Micromonospora mirobrigensis]